MGVTTKELMKMMENGQLVTSEFLPKFTKELRKAVREGNALGEGLKTSRVALQRFGNSFRLNVLDAFESGAEAGLTDLFNSLSTAVQDSAPLFKVLGRIIGSTLSVVGDLILAFQQLVRPVASLFEMMTGSAWESNEALNAVLSTIKTLYAWLLLPFALLEKLNDELSNMEGGGFLKWLINIGLALLVGRITGLFKLLRFFGGMLGKIGKFIMNLFGVRLDGVLNKTSKVADKVNSINKKNPLAFGEGDSMLTKAGKTYLGMTGIGIAGVGVSSVLPSNQSQVTTTTSVGEINVNIPPGNYNSEDLAKKVGEELRKQLIFNNSVE